MKLISLTNLTFPIEDPVLRFLLIILIILAAPLLLNKIKVPHLLGLIIAGAVIGPNGFNLLARDSSIVVTGTTGLLYIMFLAGLEIDMGDFKRNKWKSITFGLFTFAVPLISGMLLAHFVLGFSYLTSLLFASLFSTHTLISYPLLGKLGLVKNRAVNITVGGTMITDVLALLILAIVVGTTQGEVDAAFWTKLGVSFVVFSFIVLWGFPILGRWFFKKVEDKISQYIFVLVIIYLAALLAEIAGMEGIIGAFFAGLALNKLIPHTSALMNRVEFVGNAIFIPFFLISVGMLIDFKVFFKDFETIKVIILMTVVAILSKYVAAYFTQKTFNFTKLERGLIFGLSTSHAAATLAVVMVGYNIILGETELGEPIRLFNESVLNGSIVLILVSCTLSSFVTMSNGEKMARADSEGTISDNNHEEENILLALNFEKTVDPLVNLGLIIKNHKNKENIFALNIINNDKNESSVKNAEKILGIAVSTAAAADIKLQPLKRYDNDVINGVANVMKEKNITDLLIGIEATKGFSSSLIYNMYNGYLANENANVLIYHAIQPIATIKKQIVIIPEYAEMEIGFFYALLRVWNIARNSGAVLDFYAFPATTNVLKRVIKKVNIEAHFYEIKNWNEVNTIFNKVDENKGLIILMAKHHMISYHSQMKLIPDLLSESFANKNYLLIYPHTYIEDEQLEERSINNSDDFVQISKIIGKIFK